MNKKAPVGNHTCFPGMVPTGSSFYLSLFSAVLLCHPFAVCGSMTISTNRRRTVAASALGDFSIYMLLPALHRKLALRYKKSTVSFLIQQRLHRIASRNYYSQRFPRYRKRTTTVRSFRLLSSSIVLRSKLIQFFPSTSRTAPGAAF